MKALVLNALEAADRLAIRELVEAYAHCADRRDANGQMALFTADTHFVVFMNAKDDKAFTGAALTGGARSGVRRPEQVRRHHALRRTERNLHADGRPRHGGNLLPRPSRHGGRWKAK